MLARFIIKVSNLWTRMAGIAQMAGGLFSSIKMRCEFFNFNVNHNSNSKQKAAICSDFDPFG